MQLRNLVLDNYGIFVRAEFDLRSDHERPVVLITGNNGAGKTSVLEALRLALHGRRAFDVPLGEAEYLRTMLERFHYGDTSKPCSISLTFDWVDLHRTRHIAVTRNWSMRRNRIAEDLSVTIDGNLLPEDDAEDLLASIVPPQVARYFFFDGERIRELAEWEEDDESALFSAVSDLLGLGVYDQLRLDLLRLSTTDTKAKKKSGDAVTALEDAQKEVDILEKEIAAAKKQERKLRTFVDRARAAVRRVGALAHDDFTKLESEIAHLTAEKSALYDESNRAAADVLPLLCAKTLRKRFVKEVAARRALEEREIIVSFLETNLETIGDKFNKQLKLKPALAFSAVELIKNMANGGLVAVNAALPNLSRNDALWMERVIGRELPEIAARNRQIVERLNVIDARLDNLVAKRRDMPTNDPAAEAMLTTLENAQRDYVAHEARMTSLQNAFAAASKRVVERKTFAKSQRLEDFRVGRLQTRQQLSQQILDALPELSQRLHASKQLRFGRYLGEALKSLWAKTDRLTRVDVSFEDRRIALFDIHGEIRKQDLSAGEKQLFAIAFIHALARLSGRQLPFVIDTPLGRLDRSHRQRFIVEFVPKASHQVILLSTDTEIVGELYQQLQPFVAQHLELSNFNEGATAPVDLATA